MMKKILISLMFVFYSFAGHAQEQFGLNKHPKVLEVEMMLQKEASNFLQQRLPNQTIYVNINIEPLRRNAKDKTETLPYFYSEDEVTDEWDVIDTPMVMLLSRIKKATVKVEVPSSLSDVEINDLKEKLYEYLKLIPVRDSIVITKKIAPQEKDYTTYFFFMGAIAIGFVGLYFALRFSQKGVPNQNVSGTTSEKAAGPSMPRAASLPVSKLQGGVQSNKVHGDINFKDTIRASDLLKEKLHRVINSPVFPLLSDMIILEDLSKKNIGAFGAFLFEFPTKHQEKIFFRGRNDDWFKAYVNATNIDMDCFTATEKMARRRVATGSAKWEELLIQVWRLDSNSYLFLRQIPSEDAFTILAFLPKSSAVPFAKRAFPGGWARILESKTYMPIEDEAKLDGYLMQALMVKPYHSFKAVEDYKKDLELVDYLKMASVVDEEEIYDSLNPKSHIFNIRPPFYAVFKSDFFSVLFNEFDLSDWAIAMLNCPRDYIRKVNAELDEKRRYIFSNYLKGLDENPPSQEEQNEIREKIAMRFHMYVIEKLDQIREETLGTTELDSKEESVDEQINKVA